MTQVLLTRPQEKSQELAEMLQAKAISTAVQPLLSLAPVDVSDAQLAPLKQADIAIFVSQDAARYLHQLMPKLADHTRCLAVGKSTAEVVESLFETSCSSPEVETRDRKSTRLNSSH